MTPVFQHGASLVTLNKRNHIVRSRLPRIRCKIENSLVIVTLSIYEPLAVVKYVTLTDYSDDVFYGYYHHNGVAIQGHFSMGLLPDT